MTAAELKAALRAGQRVYGTLVVSPSPRFPQEVAKLGLDFVFLDTEHIPLDRAQLAWMCQTYRALGLPPLVRIRSPDPYAACVALDGGAAGVIVPYIETVAQVQALRGATKFRPLKGERLERALRDVNSLEPELRAYVDRANRDTLTIINVESTPALERLDALLAVPDVDAVLIGPHDLSCSLGLPERYDDPTFETAMRTIIRQARAAGIAAGVHTWHRLDQVEGWARAGLNLVIYGSELHALHDYVGGRIGRLKQALDDSPSRATAIAPPLSLAANEPQI